MLLFPEFFRVGVAATGPAGYLDAEGQTNVERFFGVPADEEGRARYEMISNARIAPQLTGRVLLVYGGIDESVPLRHAFLLLDAFIKADKDVDLLIVPDAAHSVGSEPYVIRRSVQYFVEHLGAPILREP
jgi:dipeptidyl aminopeptidase/acylaminoacyl peptidase